MRKAIIAGEVYSMNQGDRLIYENMAALFRKADPGIQVEALDISGRQPGGAAQAAVSRRLAWIRRAENRIPGLFSMANALWQAYLAGKRLRGAWGESLADASALVIGGGQLLMDNQLGFPVKLFALARAARRRGVPVFISACGVGAAWSVPARWLFAAVLRSAQQVTVRDPLSLMRLQRFLPGVHAEVTFDPAIWSAELYAGAQQAAGQKPIGLGVISHQDVNLHLDRGARFTAESWLALWLDILRALQDTSRQVEIFTNGSPLDQEFALKLAGTAEQALGLKCGPAPLPRSPAALAQTISGYQAVIAVRLHASILANAYSIPSIGLVWDEKVRSYYEMLGLPGRCIDICGLAPQRLAADLHAAASQGLDAQKLESARAAAFRNVSAVLQDLAAR